jgi:hypothetical protein
MPVLKGFTVGMDMPPFVVIDNRLSVVVGDPSRKGDIKV